MEELQTVLRVCSKLRKQCMQGILISLSLLILLHYLTLKPIKADGQKKILIAYYWLIRISITGGMCFSILKE